MRTKRLSLEQLAKQARHGDPQAGEALRAEFQQQLPYLVRRVLRTGRAVSALERYIWAEAQRLRGSRTDLGAAESAQLEPALTLRVSSWALRKLNGQTAEPPAQETLRCRR